MVVPPRSDDLPWRSWPAWHLGVPSEEPPPLQGQLKRFRTASDFCRSRFASWFAWWERGGFDYVERHDDRVDLFATRLATGRHAFTYVVRATTAGTFRTAPAHAEEMYEPEVFGRTATAIVEVRK